MVTLLEEDVEMVMIPIYLSFFVVMGNVKFGYKIRYDIDT